MSSQTSTPPQTNSIETNCPNCGAAWDIRGGLGICGYCNTLMPNPPKPEYVAPTPQPAIAWDPRKSITTITGSYFYSGTVSGVYIDPGPQNQKKDYDNRYVPLGWSLK